MSKTSPTTTAPVFKPTKPKKPPLANVHVWMSAPVWDLAKQQARVHGVSHGEFVEQALRFALEHMAEKPVPGQSWWTTADGQEYRAALPRSPADKPGRLSYAPTRKSEMWAYADQEAK